MIETIRYYNTTLIKKKQFILRKEDVLLDNQRQEIRQ